MEPQFIYAIQVFNIGSSIHFAIACRTQIKLDL